MPVSEILKELHTTPNGLISREVEARRILYGANVLKPKKKFDALSLILAQFKNPIILILIVAAVLSFFLREPVDSIIIMAIVLISGLLGFWQERSASQAVEKLLSLVQIKTMVLRDGKQKEVPVEDIVPGDVLMVSAADTIPGDCLIVESYDLFVNEATLTGETFPVEKTSGTVMLTSPMGQRSNTLFMGTHVVSGTARAVVVFTGLDTEFGKVSERLTLRPQETEFERGVRKFGFFLLEVTLVLVIAIFAINVYYARPVLDSFLFSLALAVGLTPQLLPAIISINLARGAKQMAREKVIVKRLASIENFGSMDILCSDKTGTLTEGIVKIHSAITAAGEPSEKVLLYAYINAFFETGFTNPIDEAIRTHRKFDVAGYKKLDEVPYDFIRKKLSIVVTKDTSHIMVTKGALPNILEVCSSVEVNQETIVAIDTVRRQISKQFEDLSSKGFRVLGVAYRAIDPAATITKDHETRMTFLGLLVLHDPPKSEIAKTVGDLKNLGVRLKVITGDNRFITAHVSQELGLKNTKILTGADLRTMSDDALLERVNTVEIFAEIEPNQKERIIHALRKSGHVVGYMGDGMNDASALHAADVGISVDSAVDIAKETADIVLLEKDLKVLVEGVREGRKTFANTLKYVFIATSANFGNMFSMAGASLFLSFLPLFPKQILLTNLLTDLPEMTISTDSVDNEMTEKPRRWNIKFIRSFMLTFGILSSVFDCLSFGVLLLILHASVGQFRTGWFMLSVISAPLAVLVIRSRRPLFKSMPSRYLLIATVCVVGAAISLPFVFLGRLFGFSPLPMSFFGFIGLIVLVYIVAAEIVKKHFYKATES